MDVNACDDPDIVTSTVMATSSLFTWPVFTKPQNSVFSKSVRFLNEREDLSQVRNLSSSTPMRSYDEFASPAPASLGGKFYPTFNTPQSPVEVCAGSLQIDMNSDPIPIDLDAKHDSVLCDNESFYKPGQPRSSNSQKVLTNPDADNSLLSLGECSVGSVDSGYTSSIRSNFTGSLHSERTNSMIEDSVDGCASPSFYMNNWTGPNNKCIKLDLLTPKQKSTFSANDEILPFSLLSSEMTPKPFTDVIDISDSTSLTNIKSKTDTQHVQLITRQPFENAKLPKSPTKRMDIVISKHFFGDTNKLIGRKMGIGKLDIVSGLSDLEMYHCTSCILKNLKSLDLMRFAQVHRNWRRVLEKDSKIKRLRMSYVRTCKKLKGGKENSLHKLRAFTESRAALGGLPLNLRQPIASVLVPGKSSPTKQLTNYDQYIHQARELVNDETLSKCPKCEGPAKVDSAAKLGSCCQSVCKARFCIRCRVDFHGADSCYPTSPQKQEPVMCNRKAKRNLRRL